MSISIFTVVFSERTLQTYRRKLIFRGISPWVSPSVWAIFHASSIKNNENTEPFQQRPCLRKLTNVMYYIEKGSKDGRNLMCNFCVRSSSQNYRKQCIFFVRTYLTPLETVRNGIAVSLVSPKTCLVPFPPQKLKWNRNFLITTLLLYEITHDIWQHSQTRPLLKKCCIFIVFGVRDTKNRSNTRGNPWINLQIWAFCDKFEVSSQKKRL